MPLETPAEVQKSTKTYLPDTNVLVDFAKDPAVRTKLEKASHDGAKFVIAPPTLTELSVGVVKGGSTHFARNKDLFTWLRGQSSAILELPKPFMVEILGSPMKLGHLKTHHQVERINLVADSNSFEEFLQRKNEAGGSWSDIEKSVEIHEQILDKEFDALKKLAALSPGSFDLATKFCERFDNPRPDPKVFSERFSAAMEYAETTIAKIRAGANPRKNDPGRFGDFQLFFYLADPDINLLTREDFSSDIKSSPQRTRIVPLDALG